jgi:hypothetical protein
MILYHGGQITDNSTFWPLSHFGPELTARYRIKDNQSDPLLSGPLCWMLYKCEIDLGQNIIDLPDWNNAYASGIIFALAKAGHIQFDSTRQKTDLLTSLNAIERDNPLHARNLVREYIEHLHISSIRYPNNHEGHINEPSYCIINPENIRVIEHFEIDPNTNEEYLSAHDL